MESRDLEQTACNLTNGKRNEIIIHRLEIGHTFLTHGHMSKKKNPPQCSACQTQLTVKHVLLLLPTWNAIRNNHFAVTGLLNLFSQVVDKYFFSIVKDKWGRPVDYFTQVPSLSSLNKHK
jgi:hypothetical protein